MTDTNIESEVIIKAISHEIRRNILRLLIGENMSYSEMAHLLDFNLKKESGKFNFHLKELVNAGLIDNKTDQEHYQLTDKGQEVYYLLVDIERDTKIDPHGLLTALIRLDGPDEFWLFLSSVTIIAMLQGFLIGLVGLFGLGDYLELQLYGGILLVLGLVGTIIAIRYYAKITGNLLVEQSPASRAISTLFLLSFQWYFVRSKNRLKYLIATFFSLFGWFISVLGGLLFIADLVGREQIEGVMFILPIGWISLIIGVLLLRNLHITALKSQNT